MHALKSSPYFQITEPCIAGEDFFKMVDHYLKIVEQIEIKETDDQKQTWSESLSLLRNTSQKTEWDMQNLNWRDGKLKYSKELFYCAVLAYYDRFNNRDENALINLFTWAMMIRVDMSHLGFRTINKYAIGEQNSSYSNTIPIFKKIYEAQSHKSIVNLDVAFNKTKESSLLSALKNINNIEVDGEKDV